MNWIFLGIAIVSEVIATSALKASCGFTRPLPAVLVIAGYASAFYFLSLTLKTLPIGIAYAVWSGVGVVLVSLSGWFIFKQKLEFPAIIGIILIITGTIILNVFSRSGDH